MGHRGNDPTRLVDTARPVRDHRRANAALVIVLLEQAIGRIRGVGPTVTVTLVRVLRAGHDFGEIARAHRAPVARSRGQVIALALRAVLDVAAPVVDRKKHQRVIKTAGPLQRRDDLADAPIHGRYLGGVDFHPPLLPGRMLDVVPGRHLGVTWRKLQRRGNDAQRFHPLEALLPQPVPAHCVTAPIGGDVVVRGVQRPMGGGIGDVQQERLIGSSLFNHSNGFGADGVRKVIVRIVVRLGFHVALIATESMRSIKAGRAAEDSVELVEAAVDRVDLVRLARQVPFAGHPRLVATASQRLGQRCAPRVQRAVGERSLVVNARQHGGSGHPAHVFAVEVGKP